MSRCKQKIFLSKPEWKGILILICVKYGYRIIAFERCAVWKVHGVTVLASTFERQKT